MRGIGLWHLTQAHRKRGKLCRNADAGQSDGRCIHACATIESAARQLAEEKTACLSMIPRWSLKRRLVEWPVPLLGRIDDAFMDVPDEVLTSVMRTHQKYFSLKNPKTNKLAPIL